MYGVVLNQKRIKQDQRRAGEHISARRKNAGMNSFSARKSGKEYFVFNLGGCIEQKWAAYWFVGQIIVVLTGTTGAKNEQGEDL